MPGGAITSKDGMFAFISISISLLSNLPSLRSFLSACLVSLDVSVLSSSELKSLVLFGKSLSSMISSANSSDL